MRNFLIIALSLTLLASCGTNGLKETTISGQVENFDNDFALLHSKGITDTIWLADDGSFTHTVMISDPCYLRIRAGRNSNLLYLNPGGDIKLDVDIKNPTENPFKAGSLLQQNSTLYDVNQTVNSVAKDFRSLYTLSQEDFASTIDSLKILTSTMIERVKGTDKGFASLENARIDYLFASWKYNYPEYNARLSGNEFEPNLDDYAFVNQFDFGNKKHFSMSEYTSLIENHINNIYYNEIARDEHKGKSVFEQTLILFDMIDSLVPDQTMQDYYKHNSTSEAVKWSSLEIAKNVAEHFVATAKSDEYRTIIERDLAKRMLLAPGQPAPEFTLTSIDGKEYSLSDFKGQIVYLDFWASWCGPCLREIPSLLKLKDAYKGKPIAFVAISIDDDKSAWEKMVNEKQLKGYQLHAEKAWQSDAAKHYQVYGVPTFVLIDGEGKIIEYPATRPSDPETVLTIDKHLKQL
jgi:thiol-disulfide isomerase/thioredoxin